VGSSTYFAAAVVAAVADDADAIAAAVVSSTSLPSSSKFEPFGGLDGAQLSTDGLEHAAAVAMEARLPQLLAVAPGTTHSQPHCDHVVPPPFLAAKELEERGLVVSFASGTKALGTTPM
jgi:hypothetical protein